MRASFSDPEPLARVAAYRISLQRRTRLGIFIVIAICAAMKLFATLRQPNVLGPIVNEARSYSIERPTPGRNMAVPPPTVLVARRTT